MKKRITILSIIPFIGLIALAPAKADQKPKEEVIELDEIDAGRSITEYDVSSCAAACEKHWSQIYRECNAQSACERFAVHQGNRCIRKCNGEDAGVD
jgi:hypothetical protein